MAVVIQYVDKKGQVIDRFLGIEHVANTNALSLKQVMENLFSKLGLSIFRLQGQGYDGPSNMQVFTMVSNVVNVVGASCKCRHIVREKQAAKVSESLNTGELSSGQGLNQETNLKRAGDTLIDVLEMILEDGLNSEQRAEANILLDSIQSFEFVFNLHLMKTILAITSELSQILQWKDQDIVNAMNLVQISKVRLQKMRESGWTYLLDDILSFCEKHEIDVPQMEDMKKLIHLAEFYPKEFSSVELMVLNDQLDTYIIDMLSNSEFSMLNEIADLAKKMVETRRDKVYPLVYLFLTLALILPVTTATVEKVFSAMNIVKNRLRNRMGDEWMNDSLVVYTERDIFDGIDNDTILGRQRMGQTDPSVPRANYP
ncbi:uncharacterized protein LOC114315439 [Camellia sinensis]|uniref:uncharacterized protein LOC114315439 n=1 Tax=Camellia sinensis TaxID=4442 RepID=UPI001036B5D7|nr:uncharacterized protein LOC114315439 [Camellia sinensis]